jgi:hypothetical protein
MPLLQIQQACQVNPPLYLNWRRPRDVELRDWRPREGGQWIGRFFESERPEVNSEGVNSELVAGPSEGAAVWEPLESKRETANCFRTGERDRNKNFASRVPITGIGSSSGGENKTTARYPPY